MHLVIRVTELVVNWDNHKRARMNPEPKTGTLLSGELPDLTRYNFLAGLFRWGGPRVEPSSTRSYRDNPEITKTFF